MAITVLDSTQNGSWGFTFTPGAGTNRLLAACAMAREDGAGAQGSVTITGIDLGATALTLDGQRTRYAASPDQSMMSAIGSLVDASLATAALDATISATPDALFPENMAALLLEGADQTTPLVDVDTQTFINTTAQPSVTVENGGIAVLCVTTNTGTDFDTVPGGYTQFFGSSGAGDGTVAAYKLITAAGTETPTVDYGVVQGSVVLASYRQVAASVNTDIVVPTGPWR